MTVEPTRHKSGDGRRPSAHLTDPRAMENAIDSLLEAMRIERSVAGTKAEKDLAAHLATALMLRRRGVLTALALLTRQAHDLRVKSSEPEGAIGLGVLAGVPPATADALRRSFAAVAQRTHPWSLPETLQWLRDDVAASPAAAVQRLSREPRLISALYATCTAVLDCATGVTRAGSVRDPNRRERATT